LKRTNVVKLIVDKDAHGLLKELGVATAKCWNEVNWLRMQQYKNGERVDFAASEKKVYGKYKHVLKVNAQQVARKNTEDWRSFFSLIKEKKEGKLPKWFKPRPPGYWKDEDGNYKKDCDRQERQVRGRCGEQDVLSKRLRNGSEVQMEAEVAREAGRLEMIYDEAKRSWYAHIPVEVENCVKVAGNLRASVDLGIINLATVYVEDGSWYVFKGGSVLS
jgi:putative transposase